MAVRLAIPQFTYTRHMAEEYRKVCLPCGDQSTRNASFPVCTPERNQQLTTTPSERPCSNERHPSYFDKPMQPMLPRLPPPPESVEDRANPVLACSPPLGKRASPPGLIETVLWFLVV